MTALRRAIDDYLTLRRRLGVTLHEAERVLVAFAAYAEREHAQHVTTDLVLRWAMPLAGIAAATVNGRCQIIRRFAQWRQLADPLVVKLLDADGDPVGNHVVNFRVTTGGGNSLQSSCGSGPAHRRH